MKIYTCIECGYNGNERITMKIYTCIECGFEWQEEYEARYIQCPYCGEEYNTWEFMKDYDTLQEIIERNKEF